MKDNEGPVAQVYAYEDVGPIAKILENDKLRLVGQGYADDIRFIRVRFPALSVLK